MGAQTSLECEKARRASKAKKMLDSHLKIILVSHLLPKGGCTQLLTKHMSISNRPGSETKTLPGEEKDRRHVCKINGRKECLTTKCNILKMLISN